MIYDSEHAGFQPMCLMQVFDSSVLLRAPPVHSQSSKEHFNDWFRCDILQSLLSTSYKKRGSNQEVWWSWWARYNESNGMLEEEKNFFYLRKTSESKIL